MADSSWSQLYDEAQSGVVAGIPAGFYAMTVDAVRPLAKSRLLFLDLKVTKGPAAGKVAQVNLYLPEPGNRGAGFHFRNKIMGFGDLSSVFGAMPEDDVETALQMLADALVGRSITAEIGLRADGEYAGQNELLRTKVTDDAKAAAPATAETAPATEVQPEPETPAETVEVPASSEATDATPEEDDTEAF